MIEGSGSVHVTNGSGSRRPNTYGSGSGSATLCPYLGPVLHTLEDLLLSVSWLVLVLSLQPGLDAPARDNITYEWWSKTGPGLSRECRSGFTPLSISGPRKIKDFRPRAPGQVFRIRIQSGQWSGSEFGIRILNPDPDPGGQKQKKVKIFHVLECWMFSFEG